MRMRIGLGYAAVRGPAGVADADVAAQAGRLGRVFHQLHAAHTAHALNHALLRAHRNTGRIIAPILQPLQAVGEKIHHIPFGAHRAHNTAHCKVLLIFGCQPPKRQKIGQIIANQAAIQVARLANIVCFNTKPTPSYRL